MKTKKYICENCKGKVSDSDKYCNNCGSMFDLDSTIIAELQGEIKRLLKLSGIPTGVEFNTSGQTLEVWFKEPKPGFTKSFVKENFPTAVKKVDKGNFTLDLAYFDNIHIIIPIQDSVTVGIDPDTDNLKIVKGDKSLLLTRAQAQYIDMVRSYGDPKSKVFGGIQIFIKQNGKLITFEKEGEEVFSLTSEEADKASTFFNKNETKISKTSESGDILTIPNSFRRD